MPAHEIIFLKLGGSLITDKTRRETWRADVLARVAGEIAEAKASRPTMRLLIGHGSGSFGHFAGREYGTRQGIIAGQEARGWYGFAVTAAAAARLNRLVVDALVAAGLPALSFQPSATAICQKGQLRELAWRPLAEALQCGVLPVIYGDVALDMEQGCTIISTEHIFAYLTPHLRPQRILLAGTVDGVFTADPLRDAQARRLSIIHAAQISELETLLGGSHGVDVTGGMLSKVQEMAQLVRSWPALTVQIFSGETPGAIRQALLDADAGLGTRLVL